MTARSSNHPSPGNTSQTAQQKTRRNLQNSIHV